MPGKQMKANEGQSLPGVQSEALTMTQPTVEEGDGEGKKPNPNLLLDTIVAFLLPMGDDRKTASPREWMALGTLSQSSSFEAPQTKSQLLWRTTRTVAALVRGWFILILIALHFQLFKTRVRPFSCDMNFEADAPMVVGWCAEWHSIAHFLTCLFFYILLFVNK